MLSLDEIAADIGSAFRRFCLTPKPNLPCLIGEFDADDQTPPRILLLLGRGPVPQPLEFSERTTGNYEHWRDESHQLSTATLVAIRETWQNVLIFHSVESPEPSAQTLADIACLGHSLRLQSQPCVIAFSLHGSGASKPQHFHAHVREHYHYGTTEGRVSASFVELLQRNVRVGAPVLCDEAVAVHEIQAAVWGLRFDFSSGKLDAQTQGHLVYQSVQRELRYASQLRLSYNLYWDVQHSHVFVLFRRAEIEAPFAVEENAQLVRLASPDAAEAALASNVGWRWGWTELIGLLQPKSPAFGSPDFDHGFWCRVGESASLDACVRRIARQRVRECLLSELDRLGDRYR